ncbi:CtsR family transcriptional regulator [Lacticaseibacillus absianus]|uniref:CtsR family transcriptional regulator n=1 Tax=Lacticaseibacillus absianus TaxID=2729623 RepID=UPI0015CEBC34|nr:CtsR family transcriptional regulator [Lacticaseibacillus absianus]
MQARNMSDVIEHYLKAMLEAQRQVEISRADVAEQFNCVPSQINYVIKTRFTPERGYVVESKRGGGGYIRILKVNLRDDQDLVSAMGANLPTQLSARDAQALIQQLYQEGAVTRQTGNVMLNVLSHQALQQPTRDAEEQLRARLMLAFLDSLRYER